MAKFEVRLSEQDRAVLELSRKEREGGKDCRCKGSNEMCGCQNVSPDDKIQRQIEIDDLQGRAENAEADLKAFHDLLDQALGGYQRDGNRTLLLERLENLSGKF